MMRKQFEEWFEKNGISKGWCSKRDLEFIKSKMLLCWKASREGLEVELPEGIVHPDDYYQDGYNRALEDITESLTNLGVKIK